MRKSLLTLAALALATTVSAKSIVFTLSDTRSTRVYFKLSDDNPPVMLIGQDGLLTIKGLEYSVTDIAKFAYSDTDYTGATNTKDGDAMAEETPVISIEANDILMPDGQHPVRVYDLKGCLRLTSTDGRRISLQSLPKGTYVITNGVSNLKIQKQ